MALRLAGLMRWFLISGCVGVLIALALMTMGTSHVVSPTVLLALWPPSIVGVADPTNLSDKIIFAIIEFGGNFLLYGIIGTLIGLSFRRKPI
jgi:uncharacterized membrane protein